jgi:hypothetical protein
MATFEKRGYIKEYDENGKLISKVRKGEEAPQPAPEAPQEDLFEDE